MAVSRYALVKNNVVENIVAWDGEGDLFNVYLAIKLDEGKECSIGWEYSDGNFTDPNAPQPATNSEMYESELAQINHQYAIDKAKLADAYLNAGLFDGASEANKKAAIYAQLQITNTKYFEDLDTLDEKYGV